MASHNRLNISDKVAVIIAIAEIQALVITADSSKKPDAGRIVNGTQLLTDPGPCPVPEEPVVRAQP